MAKISRNDAELHEQLVRHVRRGGTFTPKRAFITADDFPLGRRLASLRDRYAKGRLPSSTIALFEDHPVLSGWTWKQPEGRKVMPVERLTAAVDAHLQRTGKRRIDPYEQGLDPHDGTLFNIGEAVSRINRRSMTDDQRRALVRLLPHQVRPASSVGRTAGAPKRLNAEPAAGDAACTWARCSHPKGEGGSLGDCLDPECLAWLYGPDWPRLALP